MFSLNSRQEHELKQEDEAYLPIVAGEKRLEH